MNNSPSIQKKFIFVFITRLSVFLSILLCLVCIIYKILTPNKSELIELDKNWVDEYGNEFSLDIFNATTADELIYQQVYYTFDYIPNNTAIMFRCRNCFVNVYENDRLLYKDNTKFHPIYGKSPGSNWHTITLSASSQPSTICLEVAACYPDSNGLIDNISAGSPNDLYRQITIQRLPEFIVCILLQISGVLLIILYVFLKRKFTIGKDLLYLGITTFFSAQLSSVESLMWQFFFGYSEVFHLIGYISIVLIPLTIGWYAYSRFTGKFQIFAYFYTIVSSINLIVTYLLHFSGILEFHYTLIFTHILIAVLMPIIVNLIITYTKKGSSFRKRIPLYFLLLTICISLAIALIKYSLGIYDDYSSFIRITIVCSLICLIMYQLRHLVDTFSKGLQADMLHHIATTDNMTGLYNRTAFAEHKDTYDKLVANLKPLGIIQFDINNLKIVNDTLGHEKGDQMIQAVAEGLKLAFPTNSKCYRMGGDEFLIIIRCDDPVSVYNDGISILQDYCDDFNSQPDIEYTLQIAHGFVLTNGNMPLKDAMEKADARMYENKRKIKEE